MGREPTPDPITLVYKTVSTSDPGSQKSGVPFYVDVYPPNAHSGEAPTSEGNVAGVPAVIYFHGGGLVVGDRKSWFPEWLYSQRSSQLD
jgi:acetyl esterase/lipase